MGTAPAGFKVDKLKRHKAQRYNFGKDVFATTPISYYHLRDTSIAEVKMMVHLMNLVR